jgi:hypothetical protein
MGTYSDSLLTKDEVVIMRQRQHWLSLLLDSRIAIVLWGLTLLFVILRLTLFQGGFPSDLMVWIAGITLLAGIVVVAFRWWAWRATEYLVTNRRLVNTSGIVNKRMADSSLEKINDAILEVNLVGRLLDYGDLKILTAASGAIDRYKMLNHATAFKKAMMTAKHDLQTAERGDGDDYAGPARRSWEASTGTITSAGASGGAAAPAGARATITPIDVSGGADPLKADTPEEVAAVLAQLDALRRAGHITSGEYEVKKQELLGRL